MKNHKNIILFLLFTARLIQNLGQKVQYGTATHSNFMRTNLKLTIFLTRLENVGHSLEIK